MDSCLFRQESQRDGRCKLAGMASMSLDLPPLHASYLSLNNI